MSKAVPEVVATTFTMAAIAAPNICGEKTHVSPLIEMPAGTQLIRLTDHERLQAETERLQAARAADKARIAELEKRNEGLLGLYREAESELKQCVIDRASFSDELRACTESPGGCGYWREAAKHRAGERDHALARTAELERLLHEVSCRATLLGFEPGLIETIDAALSQQGKEGEA